MMVTVLIANNEIIRTSQVLAVCSGLCFMALDHLITHCCLHPTKEESDREDEKPTPQ
jgi:hypothetical protein